MAGAGYVDWASVTDGNGWRSGRDPVQRWLRIITTLVILAVFVYLAVEPEHAGSDLPTLALALGAVMMLLGYEGAVRMPFFNRKDEDK